MTALQMPESRYTDGDYLAHNPSWHVEDSPWKAGHVLTLLRRHGLSPRTVCEVGCGAGEILRQLHERMGDGVRFDGYEVSPQAHALAATRQAERLRYHLRDAFDEPDTTYDLVLAMDVLEHVEDCFGFLRKLRGKGTYKVLHIPLDISAVSAVGPTLMRGRRAMGHIHYFTRATALATLADTGYEVVDWFYTPGFKAPGPPNERWPARAMKVVRRAAWLVSREACVRLLGGVSIAVLAK
jgi:SAM-dependent methyltransferase